MNKDSKALEGAMFSVPISFFEQPVTKAPRSRPTHTEADVRAATLAAANADDKGRDDIDRTAALAVLDAVAPHIAQRSYEEGHRDGENSAHADWAVALGEVLPEGVDEWSPKAVAAFIDALVRKP